MAGLAGMAFELFGEMVREGLRRKKESELDVCRKALRRYKEKFSKLEEEYFDYRKQSSQLTLRLNTTITELAGQAKELTKTNEKLLSKLAAAYVRETTGGVGSLEEYDQAMAEEESAKSDTDSGRTEG